MQEYVVEPDSYQLVHWDTQTVAELLVDLQALSRFYWEASGVENDPDRAVIYGANSGEQSTHVLRRGEVIGYSSISPIVTGTMGPTGPRVGNTSLVPYASVYVTPSA